MGDESQRRECFAALCGGEFGVKVALIGESDVGDPQIEKFLFEKFGKSELLRGRGGGCGTFLRTCVEGDIFKKT
jgi:hypothetical protein